MISLSQIQKKKTKIFSIYFTSSLSPLLWLRKIQERTTKLWQEKEKSKAKNGKSLIIVDTSPFLSFVSALLCLAQQLKLSL